MTLPAVIPPGMKRCSRPTCAQPLKPTTAFDRCRRLPDGLQAWCRQCQNARAAERKRERRTFGPRAMMNVSGRTPKIAGSQYAALLAAQGGVCAICEQEESFRDPTGEVARLSYYFGVTPQSTKRARMWREPHDDRRPDDRAPHRPSGDAAPD